jgi:PRC-barrel domain
MCVGVDKAGTSIDCGSAGRTARFHNRKDTDMRKLMMITASTIALTVAGAGLAAAADNAVPARPLTPDSVGAGAIQKEDATKTAPAMEQRHSTVPLPDKSRAADSAAARSYKDNKADIAGARIPGGLSAEQLIGADVKNVSGDEIGEVEDLVVGSGNEIKVAIVEVGGFLGMGSKTVGVNIDQLSRTPTKKGFVTSMTKEELKTLPEYKKQSGSWVRSYE